MKVVGWLLSIAGVLLSLLACRMTTAVLNPASYRYGGYQPASETLNIGLLQNQQLMFEAGLAMFVAGAVLAGAGAVVEALTKGKPLGQLGTAADEAADPSSRSDVAQARSIFDPIDPRRADRNTYLILGVGGLALLIIFILGAVATAPQGTPTAYPVENNADAVAAELEAAADNMEAMADAAERNAR